MPEQIARLLSFPVDDGAVRALAGRVVGWLTADPQVRERARVGLVETVRERWSWDGVARGVIARPAGSWTGCKCLEIGAQRRRASWRRGTRPFG